jgi:homoserine O-acetyltransferase
MTVTRDAVRVDDFRFESGERLPLTVTYEAHGDPADPTVLLCHALTGSAHVATAPDEDDPDWWDLPAAPDGQAGAWWDDLVGPGRAIDTDRYHVVCANVPGSCYGTTGPASTDPETGEPYGPDFPPVTVGDWVESQRALLDALGVARLHAVVGGSVGGANALEWVRRYPDRVDRVAPVATGARLDAQGLALTALGRRAVVTDPHYRGGRYYGDGPDPDEGLAQARALAHVTYRSKAGMDRRLGRDPAAGPVGPFDADPAAAGATPLAVESYLQDRASAFVERFDANAYLYLTRAMEGYDLAAEHSSASPRSGAREDAAGTSSDEPSVADTRDASDDAAALAGFDGEALVVSVDSDRLFTTAQARHLTDALDRAGATAAHERIDSDRGHDAFLVETDAVGAAVRPFLDEGIDGDDPDRGAPVHASLLSG